MLTGLKQMQKLEGKERFKESRKVIRQRVERLWENSIPKFVKDNTYVC